MNNPNKGKWKFLDTKIPVIYDFPEVGIAHLHHNPDAQQFEVSIHCNKRHFDDHDERMLDAMDYAEIMIDSLEEASSKWTKKMAERYK